MNEELENFSGPELLTFSEYFQELMCKNIRHILTVAVFGQTADES